MRRRHFLYFPSFVEVEYLCFSNSCCHLKKLSALDTAKWNNKQGGRLLNFNLFLLVFLT